MCKCVIYTPHCNYLVLKSTLLIQTGWSVWHVTICCTYHHTYVCIYNSRCIPAGHWHWCVPRSIPMHIPKPIYIYIHIYIMYSPSYHHNGFVATYALWHMMYEFKHLLWCTGPQILPVERFCHVYNAARLFFEFPSCRTNIYFFTIQ